MTKKNVLYISIKEDRGDREYDYGDAPMYENYSRESISISVDNNAYLKRESCQELWTEEVEIAFEPIVGNKVYMVIPRYTSGGTFGQTSGYHQIYGIYSTMETASSVEEFLRLEYKNYQHNRTISTTGAFRNWMGYFESLDDIEIHELTIYE